MMTFDNIISSGKISNTKVDRTVLGKTTVYNSIFGYI